MTNSVIAPSASIIWRLATTYRIDPAPLFAQAGLNVSMQNDPNARYDADALNRVWQQVGELVKNPCFGIRAGDHWHPSDLHALGYAWLSSRNLRSSIERLCRYARIVTDVDDFTLVETDSTVSLVVTNHGLPEDVVWIADSSLAVILSMCRVNLGEDFNPESVSFIHSQPECASDYYEYFRCPVVFNAVDNRINFATATVDTPLTGANAMLAQVNDRIMIDYLAKLDKNDVIQRVRAAIIEQLPSGHVTDATVAATLNRNERTLQRQLNNEGTTFKTLLNEIRTELASMYIQDSQLSLTEISFMLGFSEIGSFSRAFNRWTGTSPSQYRQAFSGVQH